MNVNWKKGRLRGLETTSPDAATRLCRCPASGLAVVCWDWPGAHPQTEKSVLLLLSATRRRSNLDAGCQPLVAAGHAQASATSPSLDLIIVMDHLLSGVSSHSKHKRFSSQEKNEPRAQLIAISVAAYANMLRGGSLEYRL